MTSWSAGIGKPEVEGEPQDSGSATRTANDRFEAVTHSRVFLRDLIRMSGCSVWLRGVLQESARRGSDLSDRPQLTAVVARGSIKEGADEN